MTALAELSSDKVKCFWNSVLAVCAEPLLSLLGDGSDSLVDERGEALKVLKQASALVLAGIEKCENGDDLFVSHLLGIVGAFHGALANAQGQDDAICNELSRPCELWFAKKLPDYNQMIDNCLRFLLRRVASPQVTVNIAAFFLISSFN